MANSANLIIIGNGFDIAHGLKTKYSDFILWYFNNKVIPFMRANSSFDSSFALLNINNFDPHSTLFKFKDLEQIKQFFSVQSDARIKMINPFIETVFRKFLDLKWVDVETIYFNLLKSNSTLENGLAPYINKGLNTFKDEFIEYLKEFVVKQKFEAKEDIIEHLKEIDKYGDKTLVLNFNYTPTFESYLPYFKNKVEVINIHGEINNETANPIIFGYGDEMDDSLKSLEDLNDNEYLINLKSMKYHLTRNYQVLKGLLNSYGHINVYIMGHSCGISDRLLLNTIFEHDHCKSIGIFYHELSKTENDFFIKCVQLYRHFTKGGKDKAREIIKPFTLSKPLVKCN